MQGNDHYMCSVRNRNSPLAKNIFSQLDNQQKWLFIQSENWRQSYTKIDTFSKYLLIFHSPGICQLITSLALEMGLKASQYSPAPCYKFPDNMQAVLAWEHFCHYGNGNKWTVPEAVLWHWEQAAQNSPCQHYYCSAVLTVVTLLASTAEGVISKKPCGDRPQLIQISTHSQLLFGKQLNGMCKSMKIVTIQLLMAPLNSSLWNRHVVLLNLHRVLIQWCLKQ